MSILPDLGELFIHFILEPVALRVHGFFRVAADSGVNVLACMDALPAFHFRYTVYNGCQLVADEPEFLRSAVVHPADFHGIIEVLGLPDEQDADLWE